MSHLLEFLGVTKYFGNELVVDKVNFKLNPSKVTFLIGPNGAGKTTIARMILGIIKPCSGSIYVKKNLKISYLPQKVIINRHLPFSVNDFLKYFGSDKNDKIESKKILDFAHIEQLKKSQVITLSEGQMKKVALAAAILNQPDLLVLDEPTDSLDVHSEHNFYELLDYIKNTLGISVLMISHDLHMVAKAADQVLCLNHHICCSGPPKDLNLDKDTPLTMYQHYHDHIHEN